jgi:Phosphate-selective porin O and P
MKQTLSVLALAAAMGVLSPTTAISASVEDKLEILQKELDELKAEIARLKGEKAGQANAAPATSNYTSGTSEAAGAGATTIGGYGELHYNNLQDSAIKDEIDLHRFVLYFGHRFSERLRFHSEVEYEHNVTGPNNTGEVELEQAYIDYRFNDHAILRAGVMLIPLGILNETHEPPTFLGVERNQVENRIIPTTWWEGGFALHGQISEKFSYDAGVTSGFDISRFNNGSNSAPLRRARQKANEAAANDLGLFGAVRFRQPGLQIGAGVFSGNTSQDGTRGSTAVRAALKNVDAKLTLWDVHALYSIGKLDLRALFAQGAISDAGEATAALRLDTANNNVKVPKRFEGWYAEAGYHVWQKGDMDLAPFIRYEQFDSQKSLPSLAGVPLARDANTKDNITTFGVNFKLHPQVVLKADYADWSKDDTRDAINLGVGYQF